MRPLIKGERTIIRQLRRKPPNTAVYLRATAIHFSAQGLTTRQIGGMVGRDRSVVSRWIQRFHERGVAGLQPDKSTGRPPVADQEFQAALRDAVQRCPRDLGYVFTRWTCRRLAEHLHRVIHVRVSAATVGTMLRRRGYRYGRPKLDLHHRQDPGEIRRAKRQKRRALKKCVPAADASRWSTAMRPSSISIPAWRTPGLAAGSV